MAEHGDFGAAVVSSSCTGEWENGAGRQQGGAAMGSAPIYRGRVRGGALPRRRDVGADGCDLWLDWRGRAGGRRHWRAGPGWQRLKRGEGRAAAVAREMGRRVAGGRCWAGWAERPMRRRLLEHVGPAGKERLAG